jgi:hypothetical protein
LTHLKPPKQTYWILDSKGDPIEEPDLIKWATWCASGGERILRQDKLDNGVSVSTVFLGVNHNWSERGPPTLWETMIFGGPNDEYQDRYSSRDEALAGHARAVALAKQKNPA